MRSIRAVGTSKHKTIIMGVWLAMDEYAVLLRSVAYGDSLEDREILSSAIRGAVKDRTDDELWVMAVSARRFDMETATVYLDILVERCAATPAPGSWADITIQNIQRARTVFGRSRDGTTDQRR